MTEPRTLMEAVNLGKGYGIDTAETILALAIARAFEEKPHASGFEVMAKARTIFKEECAAYKSQLTKPVTEEEKKQFITMKPSNFMKVHPMSSVMQKSEAETVARNIMAILARTGDQWRPLTHDEYKAERIKDEGGNYYWMEERYFKQVIGYCVSQETAALFSPAWQGLTEEGKRKLS